LPQATPVSALANAEPPPIVTMTEEGELTEAGRNALNYAAWGAQRFDLPVELSGREDELALARTYLEERGVTVRVETSDGDMRAEWGE